MHTGEQPGNMTNMQVTSVPLTVIADGHLAANARSAELQTN